MTLTLVRDLQTQLQHFEKQLIDTNSRKEKKTSNFENHSAQNTGIGVFFSFDNVNRYCIILFIYFNVCRITFWYSFLSNFINILKIKALNPATNYVLEQACMYKHYIQVHIYFDIERVCLCFIFMLMFIIPFPAFSDIVCYAFLIYYLFRTCTVGQISRIYNQYKTYWGKATATN